MAAGHYVPRQAGNGDRAVYPLARSYGLPVEISVTGSERPFGEICHPRYKGQYGNFECWLRSPRDRAEGMQFCNRVGDTSTTPWILGIRRFAGWNF
jgi:hypothetical protein